MMYSQNQLSSNNTKGDAILHAIKCLDNERNDKVREEMMRAMGAAVHDDENAEILVRAGLIDVVKREVETKHATLVIENLGVRDKYKTKLLNCVEDLVRIGADRTLKVLRDTSVDETESEAWRKRHGVKGIVENLGGDNDNDDDDDDGDDVLNRTTCESLTHEMFVGGKKVQDEVREAGGLERLMKVLSDENTSDSTRTQAIWTMRNAVIGNERNTKMLREMGLVENLMKFKDQEAAIELLIDLARGEERMCREIVKHGIDDLLKIAEEGKSTCSDLVLDLLTILGPYKWVLCEKCGERNETGGRCLRCGGKLRFKVG